MRGFDHSVATELQNQLQAQGIEIHPGKEPLSIAKTAAGDLSLLDQHQKRWRASKILMALGRIPNTKRLNLGSLGIRQNTQGAILVNDSWETSSPGIFAVGDVASTPYALTPVAIKEGMMLSELLFGKNTKKNRKNPISKGKKLSYRNVPTAVFTSPPVATVGLTEEEAKKQGFSPALYESRFRPLKLTLTDAKETVYMKLIVCKKTDRVLGCHIVGTHAAEILQGFAVAVDMGVTKQQLDKVVGIHPTTAEELVTMR